MSAHTNEYYDGFDLDFDFDDLRSLGPQRFFAELRLVLHTGDAVGVALLRLLQLRFEARRLLARDRHFRVRRVQALLQLGCEGGREGRKKGRRWKEEENPREISRTEWEVAFG